MFNKLLKLLGLEETGGESSLSHSEPEQIISQPTPENNNSNIGGKGTMIGFDYLKRKGELDGDMPKRFINLSKFLRGNYKDEI